MEENKTVKYKKELWKKLKKDLLKIVPKKHKISIEDLEREDWEFAHPIIKLDDDYYLRGQIGGINEDCIYDWSLHTKTKRNLYNLNYSRALEINDDEKLKFVLNNFDKIKKELENTYEYLESLNEMIGLIQETANNITQSAIDKEYDKNKLRKAVRNLYKITDFIENNRLLD